MHTNLAITSLAPNLGSAQGILPAWLVIPPAVVTMLIVAAAITAAKHTTPDSRRRIRVANGWVMLLTIPLTAAGFSLIDSNTQPRLFVKVWILVIGLISISIMLALFDMLNTARLLRLNRRRLRHSIRTATEALIAHSADDTETTDRASLRLAHDEDNNGGSADAR